jgi:lysophospholipase L1-like esterase
VLGAAPIAATADQSPLRDVNGDGVVRLAAFGDSITYGVGGSHDAGESVEDITSSGLKGGYPDRVEHYLGVPVYNLGVPGEIMTEEGVSRFPRQIVGLNADFVVIMEGSNDAFHQKSAEAYSRSLQRMINVAVADNKEAVLLTIVPPVASRASLAGFTDAYSGVVRDLARVNDVLLVDVAQAFKDACPVLDQCRFLNIPEGLHPNRTGYEALGQLVAGSLLGIDAQEPNSAAQLAAVLGIPLNSVLVAKR